MVRTHSLIWHGEAAGFGAPAAYPSAAFIVYFGPNDVIANPAFQAGLRQIGPSALLLGCTAGAIIRGASLQDEAAVAVVVELDRSTAKLASAAISRETSFQAGADLAKALTAPDLAGVFLLCDSLNVDGEALLDGLRAGLPAGVPISGGLAADGANFKRTSVGANGPPQERRVAALGFYGDKIVMTQGCAHGWDVFGPPRRITRSVGLELFALDGEPALDLYERYLGDEAAQLPGSALRFPLLVSNPANPSENFVRTVLHVDHAARSVTFASAIPEGWNARLMRGAFDHLTDGARDAATQAESAEGAGVGGLAMLISCIGRRIVMGMETEDEVEAAAGVLTPRFEQIGFYSHGEISTLSSDSVGGMHNQTMTILTLREAA